MFFELLHTTTEQVANASARYAPKTWTISHELLSKTSTKKKRPSCYWDAFNTQMKPELRYSFRLG